MATLYKADGTQINLSPRNKKFFGLKELQSAVGGYIEPVYLTDNTILVVNEDGKLEKLPLNVRATEILKKHFPDSPDYIAGDAIIVESKQMK